MRFFELTRRPDEGSLFAVRLLDLVPEDVEAQLQVARFVLHGEPGVRHGLIVRFQRRFPEAVDIRRLVSIAERAYAIGSLSVKEKVQLADLLEDMEMHAKSFQIAKECLDSDESSDGDLRSTAMAIAARTAMKLGKKEEATKSVTGIPVARLGGGLADLAIQLRIEANDKEGAFEIAKEILSREIVPAIIGPAVELARELGRQSELHEVIEMNPQLEMRAMRDPDVLWQLERLGIDVQEIRERSPAFGRSRHRR